VTGPGSEGQLRAETDRKSIWNVRPIPIARFGQCY
jgi:hypothetical protein